jgi:hypothetical protein
MRAAFQPRYVPLRWDKQRKRARKGASSAQKVNIRLWDTADEKLLRSFFTSA